MGIRLIRLVLLAVPVLLALVAGGCGGSSSSASEAPEISKAAFIGKAEAICKKVTQEILDKGAPAFREGLQGGEKSEKEVEAEVIETVTAPALQSELDSIRELGAPAGDEDRVNAFIDATQEVVDEAKSDPAGYQSAQANFEHPFTKAEKLARGYGLGGCPQS